MMMVDMIKCVVYLILYMFLLIMFADYDVEIIKLFMEALCRILFNVCRFYGDVTSFYGDVTSFYGGVCVAVCFLSLYLTAAADTMSLTTRETFRELYNTLIAPNLAGTSKRVPFWKFLKISVTF